MPTPTLYRGQLIVESDPRVAALIPHGKKIEQDGKVYTVVPHKLDEYKVLRNLGYDIAPPILTEYVWPVVHGFQPFDAQRFTAALITSNKRSYVLNDLGTGKTRAALFAFDYLKAQGMVDKMIVVAPLSTLTRTWANEVMQTFPGMKVNVLYGSADKRHKLLADMSAEIYVVNHDGLAIIEKALKARADINMFVYDELTAIKNKQSERWKIADRIFNGSQQFEYGTGMTGLPTPLDPTDAYGQIKLITPYKLSGWSFTKFREHTMRKITNFKWIPREDANDRVFSMMQPSVRFTRDQCMDLPPCQVVDFECKLSAEQKTLFGALNKEFAAQLAAGEITTANEADKKNKMLQVVLGCVYKKDGGVEYLDCNPRLSVLDDIIDQSHGKVIVYTPYKHNLQMLKDHLQGRYSCEAVSGDTPVGERDRIFGRFQAAVDPRVLVAHPACMSHGLTLTEASTIVWWGLPTSPEIYEQANARITRPGQKRSQYIARIVATSLETSAYRRLQNRQDLSGDFLALIKAQQLSEVL